MILTDFLNFLLTTCNLESFVSLCNDTDRRRAHSPTMRNQGLPKSQRERNRRRAQGAESSQGAEEDDIEVEQEKTATSSSRSSKSSATTSSASAASNSQDASAGPPEDDRVWVQCNTCDKWRSLPNTVDPSLLPDIWFCELNVYDTERNCCEVTLLLSHEIFRIIANFSGIVFF
jgi:hypothetical protein